MKHLKISNYNKKQNKIIIEDNKNILNILDAQYLDDINEEYKKYEIEKIEKEFLFNNKSHLDDYY